MQVHLAPMTDDQQAAVLKQWRSLCDEIGVDPREELASAVEEHIQCVLIPRAEHMRLLKVSKKPVLIH